MRKAKVVINQNTREVYQRNRRNNTPRFIIPARRRLRENPEIEMTGVIEEKANQFWKAGDPARRSLYERSGAGQTFAVCRLFSTFASLANSTRGKPHGICWWKVCALVLQHYVILPSHTTEQITKRNTTTTTVLIQNPRLSASRQLFPVGLRAFFSWSINYGAGLCGFWCCSSYIYTYEREVRSAEDIGKPRRCDLIVGWLTSTFSLLISGKMSQNYCIVLYYESDKQCIVFLVDLARKILSFNDIQT